MNEWYTSGEDDLPPSLDLPTRQTGSAGGGSGWGGSSGSRPPRRGLVILAAVSGAFLALTSLLLAAVSISSDTDKNAAVGVASKSTSGGSTMDNASNSLAPRVNLPGSPGDHFHNAFGIYLCDQFIEPLPDPGPDTTGIHSHSDGLIHIHPYLQSSAGTNAVISKFFEMVDLQASADLVELPRNIPGKFKTWKSGTSSCEGPGNHAAIGRWVLLEYPPKAGLKTEPEVHTEGFADLPLRTDGQAWTLAFLPESEVADIALERKGELLPPSMEVLSNPGDELEPDGRATSETQPVTAHSDTLPEHYVTGNDSAKGLNAPLLQGADFVGDPIEVGGGPAMILFGANWCSHCQRETPKVAQWIDDGLLPKGVSATLVSTAVKDVAGVNSPIEWVASTGWSEQVLADSTENVAASAYGVSGFPYFVFIDADGKVAQRVSGELSREQLTTYLAKIAPR